MTESQKMLLSAKKEELRRKMSLNETRNIVKINLPSFSLIEIYGDKEVEFAYFKEKWSDFYKAQRAGELDIKISPTGKCDQYYCDWVLSEIPEINDFDEWIITNMRGDYKYFAKIKAGDKFDSIKELWHMDKSITNKNTGYVDGIFAINATIKKFISVGCFLGPWDLGFHPEYNYQLEVHSF